MKLTLNNFDSTICNEQSKTMKNTLYTFFYTYKA